MDHTQRETVAGEEVGKSYWASRTHKGVWSFVTCNVVSELRRDFKKGGAGHEYKPTKVKGRK